MAVTYTYDDFTESPGNLRDMWESTCTDDMYFWIRKREKGWQWGRGRYLPVNGGAGVDVRDGRVVLVSEAFLGGQVSTIYC